LLLRCKCGYLARLHTSDLLYCVLVLLLAAQLLGEVVSHAAHLHSSNKGVWLALFPAEWVWARHVLFKKRVSSALIARAIAATWQGHGLS